MKRTLSRFGIASLTALSLACSTEQIIALAHREAVSKIADELVSTSAIELKSRVNPWGSGLFVYGSGISDLDKRYVWISLRSRNLLAPKQKIPNDTFSVTKEASNLTPGIPLLSTASDKVLNSSGLTSVAWGEIVAYLRTGAAIARPVRMSSSRRKPVESRSSVQPVGD